MSILIRGMEMPTSCADCRFAVDGWCYACLPESKAERKRITTNYCPLVSVPPHGRLIDADKLGIRDAEKQAYEAYLRSKGEDFLEEPIIEYHRGYLEGLTHASGLVRFAPTIIPAEKEGEA